MSATVPQKPLTLVTRGTKIQVLPAAKCPASPPLLLFGRLKDQKCLGEYPGATCGANIDALWDLHKYKAAEGSSVVKECDERHCGLMGLGDLPTATPKQIAVTGEKVGRGLADLACVPTAPTSLVLRLDCLEKVDAKFVEMVAYGVMMAAHVDDRFKGKPDEKFTCALDTITIVVRDGIAVDGYPKAIERAAAMAAGCHLMRQLAAAPPNICHPPSLATVAREIATRYGMKIDVKTDEECTKLGMGAYLAVCVGSEHPAQFIHITYTPKTGTPAKKVALVGKGVTMDTGGYNIKNAMMVTMKGDMTGSAAVLGVAETLGRMQPNVEVHVLVPAAENMIDGKAYRPGDILTASNGKTIEVGNTDAEGRLCMCDALVFAEKTVGADVIIDIATLTGAEWAGLGNRYAAVMGPDEELCQSLLTASRTAGENLWQLPFCEEYKKDLESKIADINNITGTATGGGSITAGLFLKEFVEKTPYAHLDIAGPMMHPTMGMEGICMRTLMEYILSLC